MKIKVLIGFAVIILSGCEINIYQNNPNSSNQSNLNNPIVSNQETNGLESKISLEQALSIALNDAGFNKQDVMLIKQEQELENNILEYDVEFIKGNIKYEYTINQDGNIIQKEQENKLVD